MDIEDEDTPHAPATSATNVKDKKKTKKRKSHKRGRRRVAPGDFRHSSGEPARAPPSVAVPPSPHAACRLLLLALFLCRTLRRRGCRAGQGCFVGCFELMPYASCLLLSAARTDARFLARTFQHHVWASAACTTSHVPRTLLTHTHAKRVIPESTPTSRTRARQGERRPARPGNAP